MSESRYHHGDLRPTLEREAKAMLAATGIEGLSLRKLAERVGVSPPALYHHFRDKNDLLCALAAEGFDAIEREVFRATEAEPGPPSAKLRAFVFAYVRFATREPETYDLMFGRTIWKAGAPTPALRETAYASFRRYFARVGTLVSDAGLEGETDTLRLAQASWAMLHGLCRLRIDGIYVDAGDLDAMCEEAVRFVITRLRTS